MEGIEYIIFLIMEQKTRFKNFGNISIGPWMVDVSVSASKKPYQLISSVGNIFNIQGMYANWIFWKKYIMILDRL